MSGLDVLVLVGFGIALICALALGLQAIYEAGYRDGIADEAAEDGWAYRGEIE
jgi:hypothetical protein